MVNHIYNCYKKALLNALPNGQFEILRGGLTDEEAQKAIRGINANKEEFEIWAKKDISDFFIKNKFMEFFGKLQIKAECNYEYNSYLIYLNYE